jgi:hypothetical protein
MFHHVNLYLPFLTTTTTTTKRGALATTTYGFRGVVDHVVHSARSRVDKAASDSSNEKLLVDLKLKSSIGLHAVLFEHGIELNENKQPKLAYATTSVSLVGEIQPNRINQHNV